MYRIGDVPIECMRVFKKEKEKSVTNSTTYHLYNLVIGILLVLAVLIDLDTFNDHSMCSWIVVVKLCHNDCYKSSRRLIPTARVYDECSIPSPIPYLKDQ
jgi:hypothetical protein